MIVRDTFAGLERFLRQRQLTQERAALLLGHLQRDFLLALGRRLLSGPTLPAQLDEWTNRLLPCIPNRERYGLRVFARYVHRGIPQRSLGDAMDEYLRSLKRRGRGPGTRKVHRRAVRRLARFVAANALVERVPARLWRMTFAELLTPRPHVLSSALHHYAVFLSAQRLAEAPLTFFRRVPTAERRLERCLALADHAQGFAGALGRYLRMLRDERQLSLPHLLDVHARLLRFHRHVPGVSPTRITRAHVARYRDRLLIEGHVRAHAAISLLRRFFAFLCREGAIQANPTQDVHAKVISPPRRVALTRSQLRALLDAPLRDLVELTFRGGNAFRSHRVRFVALRDRAILALFVETGLRPVELRSLALTDLDLHRGVITVHGKGCRGASVRNRFVYLESPLAFESLRAYLAVRPLGPESALFLSRTHRSLTGYCLAEIVARRAHQAEIGRPVRPYDLRVSFASRLVQHGVDPFALRVLMGHDTIQTTFSIYTALTLEEVRSVWRETNPLSAPPVGKGDVP